MAGKNSIRFPAASAAYCGPGSRVREGGIYFGICVPADADVSLVLYRCGEETIFSEIPFPASDYAGAARAMTVADLDPDGYEYRYRIDGMLTADPAGRRMNGHPVFGKRDKKDTGDSPILRAGFVQEDYDWKEDHAPLKLPWEDIISYHLHVRGFTMSPSSRVKHRGTFRGIQEKIPYLKRLGVNQIILMPAYEFDEVMERPVPAAVSSEEPRVNYWGYGDGCYYAPKQSYSVTGDPVKELRTLVRALHRNGIEILMEFSVTGAMDATTLSDCLRWWRDAYHIDGFRLMMDPQMADAIQRDPTLAGAKLIVEQAADAPRSPSWLQAGFLRTEGMQHGGLFTVGEQSERPQTGGREAPDKQNARKKSHNLQNLQRWEDRIAVRNAGFRGTARRLLKGDEGQLEEFVRQVRNHPEHIALLNCITGHDGFCLMDLVSYDKKHNEANGEQNQDGSACEFSWNCGVEGSTTKRAVRALRLSQMKNAFAMLLLSQGTPVIEAGDEFGNTQFGNNNPYCQDNEVTWLDWRSDRMARELTAFVRTLSAFRREHRILHPDRPLSGTDRYSCGYPDFSCHSSRAWYGDFEYQNRHVGLMYCGMEDGADAAEDALIYVAYNFHWEPRTLALPHLPEGMCWEKILDTLDPTGTKPAEITCEREIEVRGRSVCVFTSKRTALPQGEAPADTRRTRRKKQ